MPNLAVNVALDGIRKEAEAGKIPQARAVSSPKKYHAEIIETIAGMILGNYRPSHPDIMIIGSAEKPPSVENCRFLIDSIAMKPIESKRRLAVIQNADKLNKNAGNALLKLTEEPPSHAYILYVMEDMRLFLPTLRSRTQCTVITAAEEIEPEPVPQDPQEWLDWLTKARKTTSDDETITNDIASWEEYEKERGNIYTAAILEKLRQISMRKNISVPMLSDLIILMLKDGGNENEDILNDIWEA